VNRPPIHITIEPPAPECGAAPRCLPHPSDFLVWQLADSAFPTGGFAHSAGLEAAWQHGAVRTRVDLVSFLDISLHQLGHSALPFVTAAHEQPNRLDEFDWLCEAFTNNHVANRASRVQGRALLAAVERIFPNQDSALNAEGGGRKAVSGARMAEGGEPVAFAHFAPVFGAMLRVLGVPRDTAARLFLFNHLRGLLAAAVRLNLVGPMEAQSIQNQFASRAEEILAACGTLTLDDLAQTSPLLDLWQGAQDRLYSRLFQS
jgi:urease accessory protein